MSEIIVASADQGKTFTINQGDIISVRLEEKSIGGGYQWKMETLTSNIVEFIEDQVIAQRTGIGGGRTRIFRFRAKSLGTVQIRWYEQREWESSPIQSFFVNICVQH